MERPKSIIAFERAFWASFAVGLIGSLLTWDDVLKTYQRDPSISAMGFGSGFLIAILGISFGIQLLFWYFIARKASNVMRWIYAVLMALGIVSSLAMLNDPALPGGISLVFSLGSSALTALAIFFLFRPDASAWLTNKRDVDPDTFR